MYQICTTISLIFIIREQLHQVWFSGFFCREHLWDKAWHLNPLLTATLTCLHGGNRLLCYHSFPDITSLMFHSPTACPRTWLEAWRLSWALAVLPQGNTGGTPLLRGKVHKCTCGCWLGLCEQIHSLHRTGVLQPIRLFVSQQHP